MEILQITWLVLLAVLLAAFLICGGFDFGAGMLLCRMSKESKARAMLEIAPFWDGNQVWLITAGGALFAAFPKAYALVLSNLYIPVILLLTALIFRVVAIEFFLALGGEKWRGFWAAVCCVSSVLSMALVGVALGAMFGGQILQKVDGGFWANFARLFTPMTIAAGILTVVFCLAQGSVYLGLKNVGDEKFFASARNMLSLLAVAYIAYIFLFMLYGKSQVLPRGLTVGVLFAAYLPITIAVRTARRKMMKTAFFMTSLFALVCVAAHVLGAFPYIVSPFGTSEGVDIYAASSSMATLRIMLGVAVIGVPLALGYFIYSHFVFSKKRGGSVGGY